MAKATDYVIELTAKNEGIKKGLAQTRAEVSKHAKNLTKEQKVQAEKIVKIKKDLIDKEEKFIEDSVKHHTEQLEKELKAVEGNARKEFQIKKKFLDKIEKLQKDAAQAQAKNLSRTADATSDLTIDTGEFNDEMGTFGTVVTDVGDDVAALGGSVGRVLGKVGPLGKAIGIGVGALFAMGAGAKKAAAEFDQFNDVLQRMQGVGTLTNKEIKNIGINLLQIARPASISAAGVAEIAESVANFPAAAEEIPKITKSILTLVAAFPDVNPVEVTLGMQRLTKQLGDSTKAFDVLAAQAQVMKGKSLDPLGEAASELGTVFTKASVAVDNSGKAMDRAQLLFNSYLGVGNEVSESTSTSEIAFEKLNATVRNTKDLEKYKLALEGSGKTLEDVGLVAGDLDIQKLTDFFLSGEKGSTELNTALAANADELNLLVASLAKSGKAMGDFAIETAGAGKATEDMRTIAQKNSDALKQNYENLMINLGQSTSGIVASVTGGIADIVGGLAGLFEPANVTYDKAIAKAQEFNDTIGDMNELLDNPSLNTEKQLGLINDELDEIAEISPFVAEEIKRIQADTSLEAAEQLEQINSLLEGTITLAEDLRDVEAFAALDTSAEMFSEGLFEIVSDADKTSIAINSAFRGMATGGISSIGDLLGVWNSAAPEMQLAMVNAIDASIQKIPELKDEVAGLREHYMSLGEGSKERLAALNKWRDAQKELTGLVEDQSKFQKLTLDLSNNTLDALTAMVGGNIELVDSNEAYMIALAELPPRLQESVELQKQLREEIDKQLATKLAQNAIDKVQINTAQVQLTYQDNITFANEATKDEKLKILKATKAQIMAEKIQAENLIKRLKAAMLGQGNLIKLLTKAVNLSAKYAINMGAESAESAEAYVTNVISDLEQAIATMDTSLGAIDKQIEGLAVGARRAPGKAAPIETATKGGAEKIEKKADEVAKALEDYQKAVQNAEENYRKALRDLKQAELDRANQLEIKEFKNARDIQRANRERLKAEKELQKQIKEFAADIKTQAEGFEKEQIENISQLLSDMIDPITLSVQRVREFAQAQEAMIAGIEEKLIIDKEALIQAKKQLQDKEAAQQEELTLLHATAERTRDLNDEILGLKEAILKAKKAEEIRAAAPPPQAGGISREEVDELRGKLKQTSGKSRDWMDSMQALAESLNLGLDPKVFTETFTSRTEAGVRDLESRLSQIQDALDRQVATERRRPAAGATGPSSEVLKTEELRVQNQLNKAIAEEDEFSTRVNELNAEIVSHKDNIEMLTKNIVAQEETVVDLSSSEGAEKVLLIARLKEILSQQNKVADLQRSIAHELDPIHRANLERDLVNEQKILETTRDRHGFTEKSLEKAMETALETMAGTEGVSETITAMQENMAANYNDIDDITDKISENTRTIERNQNQLGEGLENDATTYTRIGGMLKEQAALFRRIVKIKKDDLKNTELTKEEFDEINDEISEYERGLKDIEEQIDTNTAALDNQNIQQEKSIEDKAAKIQEVFAAIKTAVNATSSILTGIVDLFSAEDAKEVLGIVTEITNGIAEIASMFGPIGEIIGEALGAAAAIIEVIAMAVENEVSQSQRLTIEFEKQAALLEAQFGIIERLIAIGDIAYDTTLEQLEAYREILEVNSELLGIKAQIGDEIKNEQAIIDRIAEIQTYNAGLEERIAFHKAKGKSSDEDSAARLQGLVNANNDLVGELENQLGIIGKISEFEKQINVEYRLRLELMENINLLQNDYQAAVEAAGAALESQMETLQDMMGITAGDLFQGVIDMGGRGSRAAKDLIDPFITYGTGELNEFHDYLLGLSEDVLATLDQDTQAAISSFLDDWSSFGEAIFADAENLIKLRKEAGFIIEEGVQILYDETQANADLLKLYEDQYVWLLQNSGTEEQLLEASIQVAEQQEVINKALEDGLETLDEMKLLREKLAALDHEHAMDRIDDEKYLEDKLELLEEMWQLSIDTNAPIEEQRRLELQIHELLEDQLRLKEEALGLDDQSLKKLAELVRKRQQAIEQARAGQADAGQVEEVNQRIRAELVSQGMSDEEIARFMATLPSREAGGEMTDGLYKTHGTKQDPEFAHRQEAVKTYGLDFMHKLNNLEIPVPQTRAMRNLTAAAMTNNNNQNITIQVFVTQDWEISGSGTEIATEIASRQKEFLYDAINEGVQSRRINLIGGGRV